MSTNKLCKNLNIRTLKVKYKTVYYYDNNKRFIILLVFGISLKQLMPSQYLNYLYTVFF